MPTYNKLVRDRIPEIIERKGGSCKIKILQQEEFVQELKKKLHEELKEYEQAKTNEEALAELVDVCEIIRALVYSHGFTMEILEKARKEKEKQRGGFEKRIYLMEASDMEQSKTKMVEIELAREILNTFPVQKSSTLRFPIRSSAKEVVRYKDHYIEIYGAKDTDALEIRIYNPLTTARMNPIIQVDDSGHCFRTHGESIYFRLYAEVLLGKEPTLFKNPAYEQKQNEIMALAKEERKFMLEMKEIEERYKGNVLTPEQFEAFRNSGMLGHFGILQPFSMNYVNADKEIMNASATITFLANQLLLVANENPSYEFKDPVVLQWLEWAKKNA